MKILDLLGIDKETRKANKTKRIGKALQRSQDSLIDDLEARRDDLLETKESLLSQKIDKVDPKTWNSKYHNSITELMMIEKEIEIAKATMEELFSDSKTSK